MVADSDFEFDTSYSLALLNVFIVNYKIAKCIREIGK